MPLNLIFPGTPKPHADRPTAFAEEARRAVLERLAEVIAKAGHAKPQAEGSYHD